MVGGPGWVVPGVLKMLGGALLAWLALRNAVPAERAIDPNQMYLIGFSHVFDNTSLAIAATVVFVIVSQLKINVTNAYAGSLAWSNVFARLTHSHPGRVVWVVFNCLIALMLMELNVFQAIGQVLGLYSNIAISWMAAVVADLVINKPLGLSPPGWSSSAATCTTSTRWGSVRWRSRRRSPSARLPVCSAARWRPTPPSSRWPAPSSSRR
jgi:purine-cytosine permease-like protein